MRDPRPNGARPSRGVPRPQAASGRRRAGLERGLRHGRGGLQPRHPARRGRAGRRRRRPGHRPLRRLPREGPRGLVFGLLDARCRQRDSSRTTSAMLRGRRVLVDRIRSKVRFERLNLVGAEDYAAAGAFAMDLILCRNVLIYFGHEKVGRIAARLYDSLAEGGVLLTAGADPILSRLRPLRSRGHARGPRVPAPPPRRHRGRARRGSPGRRRPGSRLRDRERRAADREEPAATVAVPPSPPELGREAFARVMGHANASGAEAAERIAQAALRRHPLDAPLHYLRASLLLSLDRDEEAEHEAQRALYLDRIPRRRRTSSSARSCASAALARRRSEPSGTCATCARPARRTRRCRRAPARRRALSTSRPRPRCSGWR